MLPYPPPSCPRFIPSLPSFLNPILPLHCFLFTARLRAQICSRTPPPTPTASQRLSSALSTPSRCSSSSSSAPASMACPTSWPARPASGLSSSATSWVKSHASFKEVLWLLLSCSSLRLVLPLLDFSCPAHSLELSASTCRSLRSLSSFSSLLPPLLPLPPLLAAPSLARWTRQRMRLRLTWMLRRSSWGTMPSTCQTGRWGHNGPPLAWKFEVETASCIYPCDMILIWMWPHWVTPAPYTGVYTRPALCQVPLLSQIVSGITCLPPEVTCVCVSASCFHWSLEYIPRFHPRLNHQWSSVCLEWICVTPGMDTGPRVGLCSDACNCSKSLMLSLGNPRVHRALSPHLSYNIFLNLFPQYFFLISPIFLGLCLSAFPCTVPGTRTLHIPPVVASTATSCEPLLLSPSWLPLPTAQTSGTWKHHQIVSGFTQC